MEKADNTTPSSEELAIYMEESIVSVTSAYEQSPVVLMVDDAVIGTLGNFSASIGKAKSKKTFNVSAIVASALRGSTILHYRSTFPKDKRKVLYVDTEQGRYHCQNVLKRILRLADLPENKEPDNLVMLALRKYSPDMGLILFSKFLMTILFEYLSLLCYLITVPIAPVAVILACCATPSPKFRVENAVSHSGIIHAARSGTRFRHFRATMLAAIR